jgi:hypothetical protein
LQVDSNISDVIEEDLFVGKLNADERPKIAKPATPVETHCYCAEEHGPDIFTTRQDCNLLIKVMIIVEDIARTWIPSRFDDEVN